MAHVSPPSKFLLSVSVEEVSKERGRQHVSTPYKIRLSVSAEEVSIPVDRACFLLYESSLQLE